MEDLKSHLSTYDKYNKIHKKITKIQKELSEEERALRVAKDDVEFNRHYVKRSEKKMALCKLNKKKDMLQADIVSETFKIFSLMDVIFLGYKLNHPVVKNMETQEELTPVHIIRKDTYSDIRLYVIQEVSKRSKITYTLILVFDSLILKRHYIEPIMLCRGDIFISGALRAIDIKTGKSEKELSEYAKKYGEQILSNCLPLDFKRYETLYKKAKVLYKDLQWKKAYLENKKDKLDQGLKYSTYDRDYKKVLRMLSITNTKLNKETL